MEQSMAIVATSSPPAPAPEAAESQISALLYDVSQQVQTALQNMLKATSDIDQSVSEIGEELEKCKESVALKNRILEEEKERIQKAALAVLEMLNAGGSI